MPACVGTLRAGGHSGWQRRQARAHVPAVVESVSSAQRGPLKMRAAALLLASLHIASAAVPSLPLPNAAGNATIPRILLGTGGGAGGYNAGLWLSAGGPGFDTAQTYCYSSSAPFCSQVAIANALQAAGDETSYIISKTEPEDFGGPTEVYGMGRPATNAVMQMMSLKKLPMLMFHQAGRHESDSNVRPPCFNASAAGPAGPGTYAACRIESFAAAVAGAVASGVAAVGVSNWQQRELQQAFDATGHWPAALEVEFHPYWHEDALIAFCAAHGIVVVNYAPLAVPPSNGLLREPAVLAVAAAHGITPAQAVLKWGLQKSGGVVIPRSANATHMAENLAVFGLPDLTPAELTSLSGFPQKKIFATYCQPWC